MEKYFTKDFNQFFIELAPNNNKDWFDIHRERYYKSVKFPFEKFVQDLITSVQKSDKEIKVGPKDCIFRINRDIRFAKDKIPYKMNTSALISPNGRKDMMAPGFYFEFGPEKIAVYGGLYMLDSASLLRVRNYIAKHLNEFNKLISDKQFVKTFGHLQGETSSRINKELKPAAEKQPLLMQKQFYFGTETSASKIASADILKTMLEYYKIAQPLNLFFRKAIGG